MNLSILPVKDQVILRRMNEYLDEQDRVDERFQGAADIAERHDDTPMTLEASSMQRIARLESQSLAMQSPFPRTTNPISLGILRGVFERESESRVRQEEDSSKRPRDVVSLGSWKNSNGKKRQITSDRTIKKPVSSRKFLEFSQQVTTELDPDPFLARISVRVISGYAGTGKTFSVCNSIREEYAWFERYGKGFTEDNGIILAGPTGMAVHSLVFSGDFGELKKKTLFWGTLAKLSGYVTNKLSDDPRIRFSTQKLRRLIGGKKHITFVIDEFFACTTEDLNNMTRVISTIGSSCKTSLCVILSGDPYQLSPPDGSPMDGQITFLEKLKEIYNSEYWESRDNYKLTLTEFHRFEYENIAFGAAFETVITALATRQAPDPGCLQLCCERWALNRTASEYSSDGSATLSSDVTHMVWSNKRADDLSTARRNQLINENKITKLDIFTLPMARRPQLGSSTRDSNEMVTFFTGEGAVIVRNICIEQGVYNGTRCTILKPWLNAFNGLNGIVVSLIQGGVETNFSIPYMPDFEDQADKNVASTITFLPVRTDYALTCHRAQGQTIDGRVCVDRSVTMDNREGNMLYVAMTRSKYPERMIFTGFEGNAISLASLLMNASFSRNQDWRSCTAVASELTINRQRLTDFCKREGKMFII